MGCGPSKLAKAIVITVKTSDVVIISGTNNDVYVILQDNLGKKSSKLHLDNIFKNDFKKGKTDTFVLTKEGLEELGPIKKIYIWREGVIDDRWLVEHVKVTNQFVGTTSIFPINRWVPHNEKLAISEYDSSLPADDVEKEQRSEELENKKVAYEFFFPRPGIPPMVKDLPLAEHFSDEDQFDLGKKIIKLKLESDYESLVHHEWDSLDDIKKLFGKDELPEPKCVSEAEGRPGYWMSDEFFAEQRVSGCNPVHLRLCQEIPENFAVTPEILEPFLEGLTLQNALETKKIFIVNHKITENIKPKEGYVVCSPMCLLYLNKDNILLPVAIQLFQQPADDNLVFLPSDDKITWVLAKMWFNNADAQIHESNTHLALTHLLIGAVVLASHRQLSMSHPLMRLMMPHFLYCTAINALALKVLINPGGFIDSNMSVGIDGAFELVREAFKEYRMDEDSSLPKYLAKRGVIDPEVLPHYPFRDDGLPVYNAVNDYVKEIVHNIYGEGEKGRSQVENDTELQAWVKELTDPEENNGCGIKGIGTDGKFTSVDEVVETITNIIFIASAIHAAVNFNQYNQYAFPPAYPAILRGEPPKDKSERFMSDIIKTMPDQAATLEIMVVTSLLSTNNTDSLGYFEVQYDFKPASLSALDKLRSRLADINEDNKRKNLSRVYPYTVLLPSGIPNAISI